MSLERSCAWIVDCPQLRVKNLNETHITSGQAAEQESRSIIFSGRLHSLVV